MLGMFAKHLRLEGREGTCVDVFHRLFCHRVRHEGLWSLWALRGKGTEVDCFHRQFASEALGEVVGNLRLWRQRGALGRQKGVGPLKQASVLSTTQYLIGSESERYRIRMVQNLKGSKSEGFRIRKVQNQKSSESERFRIRQVQNQKGSESERFRIRKVQY